MTHTRIYRPQSSHSKWAFGLLKKQLGASTHTNNRIHNTYSPSDICTSCEHRIGGIGLISVRQKKYHQTHNAASHFVHISLKIVIQQSRPDVEYTQFLYIYMLITSKTTNSRDKHTLISFSEPLAYTKTHLLLSPLILRHICFTDDRRRSLKRKRDDPAQRNQMWSWSQVKRNSRQYVADHIGIISNSWFAAQWHCARATDSTSTAGAHPQLHPDGDC